MVLAAAPLTSRADALKSSVVGCNTVTDAKTLASLKTTNPAAAQTLGRSLVASRACLDFAEGLTIDVDERRPPLVCIRLQGDLSCYWIAAASLDEHPGEKGSGGGSHRGGKHR